MYPTLLDIYSRETFRDVGAIYRTYRHFGYYPIVFVHEESFQTVCTVDGEVIEVPLIAAYMLKLLQSAKEKTDEVYPDFLAHTWRIGNGYFKKLVFTSEDFSDAKILFWKKLKELADSGDVTVCETVVEDTFTNHRGEIENRVTLTSMKGPRTHSYKDCINYNCDTTPRSWVWNDIKNYFVELNSDEIALLNGKELNYHTDLDLPLFEACYNRDLSAIKNAVEQGANVNAINDDGETPISLALDFSEGYDDSYLISILDYLIQNGADVNLFGFEGTDCFTCAHLSDKPRMIEYLFEHGARKDLNCYVTDLSDTSQWYDANAAYSSCLEDRAIGDYYDDNCQEQINIFEKHGVNFFIDGWDAKRLGWED